MKVSKEQTEANRLRILAAASKLFRERGFDGVGVADIMNEAGFTHGGFYNHFPSKEALAAEACGADIAQSAALREKWTWAEFADEYLGKRHRDRPETGCSVAALGGDAGRQGAEVQDKFAEGIETTIERLTASIDAGGAGGDEKESREKAIRLFAELVGAIVLSRAVKKSDAKLSDEILDASRSILPKKRKRGT
jgi:TetR/AcrR family transcriptional regulator, transcriptional repressor for nem operon